MRFLRKPPIVVLLFVTSVIQSGHVESSSLPGAKEVALTAIDYGVSFAPEGSQDALKFMLKSAAAGIGASLEQSAEESTGILAHHIDVKIDGLEQLLRNQSGSTLSELDGIRRTREHTKLDQMFQELNRFADYYNFQYVECVEKKKCDSSTRNEYFVYWLNPHSEFRMNMFDFVNKYILDSSKYSNGDSVFGLVLKINKRNNAGRRPYWAHHESVQNTIYTFYKYTTESLIRMYHVTLRFMTEDYRNESGNKKGIGSLEGIATLLKKARADLEAISLAAKNALASASRDIYPDDPTHYEKGKNYNLLRRFLVTYMKMEKPLDTMYDFWLKENFPDSRFKTMQLSKLNNCTTNHFSHVSKIFIDLTDDDRFYHHFVATGEIERTYGNKNITFYGDNIITFKNPYWPYFTVRNSHLKTLINLCYLEYPENDFQTVRNFSKSMARASPGNVITGVKLVIYNANVHLQIQEGRLVRGTIKPDTVKWKPIEETHESPISLNFSRRSFNLDDIIIPDRNYLTGVQFFNTRANSIALRAIGRNVTDDGFLIHDDECFFQPDDGNREEIILDKPDISINAPHDRQHVIRSKSGESYVKFQTTDLEKDAGQTTVPFFDTQPVVTIPPTPLGGVGIHYKEMSGFGGFIALKLISVNVAYILNNEAIEDRFARLEKHLAEEKKTISS